MQPAVQYILYYLTNYAGKPLDITFLSNSLLLYRKNHSPSASQNNHDAHYCR